MYRIFKKFDEEEIFAFQLKVLANLVLKIYRCLPCTNDCDKISAVADDGCACGCLIGCYEKTWKLCDDSGSCQHCHKGLIDVL
ncbi:unnamed protein product [Onchocerca flexuosa]|uniref:Uncharacterized protein n=1 Tax=Onchocerca flexuosa TaxID=387005 RepID=A0A183HCB3_9BILA|nr:unnamed protein product [Onchocerca flexuosa]